MVSILQWTQRMFGLLPASYSMTTRPSRSGLGQGSVLIVTIARCATMKATPRGD